MHEPNQKKSAVRKYTEIGHYNEAKQDPRHKEAYEQEQKKIKQQEQSM